MHNAKIWWKRFEVSWNICLNVVHYALGWLYSWENYLIPVEAQASILGLSFISNRFAREYETKVNSFGNLSGSDRRGLLVA